MRHQPTLVCGCRITQNPACEGIAQVRRFPLVPTGPALAGLNMHGIIRAGAVERNGIGGVAEER
jgi:hypothetical protein